MSFQDRSYAIPYGKVPLKVSNGPVDEALAGIASAVEKARRGDQMDAPPPQITDDQESEYASKMNNGKYYEIPHLLDGFRMLNVGAPAEDPEEVYSLDISGMNLSFVLEDDLSLFTKLQILKAGENHLTLAKFGGLPNLRKLIMPCNDVTTLDLEVCDQFESLQYLDLSFNAVHDTALIMLGTLPSLEYLDLTRNSIRGFPEVLKDMSNYKDNVIELLLPKQVAQLDAGMQASESRNSTRPLTSSTKPTGDVTENLRRSFVKTVSQARLDTARSSVVSPRKSTASRGEGFDRESRPSTTSRSIRSRTLHVGYPSLTTLILEGNKIQSPEIFGILGSLPCLRILNMNHNRITSPTKWAIWVAGKLGLAHDLHTYDQIHIRKARLVTKEEELAREKEKVPWEPKDTKDFTMQDFWNMIETQPDRQFMIISDRVLDVTGFTQKHPGGSKLIRNYVGKDGTKGFYGKLNNHTKSARLLLEKMEIGTLIPDMAKAAA